MGQDKENSLCGTRTQSHKGTEQLGRRKMCLCDHPRKGTRMSLTSNLPVSAIQSCHSAYRFWPSQISRPGKNNRPKSLTSPSGAIPAQQIFLDRFLEPTVSVSSPLSILTSTGTWALFLVPARLRHKYSCEK